MKLCRHQRQEEWGPWCWVPHESWQSRSTGSSRNSLPASLSVSVFSLVPLSLIVSASNLSMVCLKWLFYFIVFVFVFVFCVLCFNLGLLQILLLLPLKDWCFWATISKWIFPSMFVSFLVATRIYLTLFSELNTWFSMKLINFSMKALFNRFFFQMSLFAPSIFNFLFFQVDAVVTACKNPKLNLGLFSATISPVVDELAKSVLRFPVDIYIGER